MEEMALEFGTFGVAPPVIKSTGMLFMIKMEDEYKLQVLFHKLQDTCTVKDVSPPGNAKIPKFIEVVDASHVHTTIAMLKQWASGSGEKKILSFR